MLDVYLLQSLVGQWLVLDLVVQVGDIGAVVLAPVDIQGSLKGVKVLKLCNRL